MQGLFSETVFGVPWVAIAAVALAVAVLFVVIDTSAGAEGWRYFVTRWFHSLCWVFLALGALARAKVTPLPVDWAGALAGLGGLIYLAFLVASLVGRP